MNPEITVIVPVYNGEDYLEACIDSILRQTEPLAPPLQSSAPRETDLHMASARPAVPVGFELQIIIVNDGSTDQTPGLCERLREQHPALQVINLPDLGVSSARNAGLAAAAGDYITFVDADDRLFPGTLSHLLAIARETNSEITGCDFRPWHTPAEYERICQTLRPAPREAPEASKAEGSGGASRLEMTGAEFIDKGILGGDTRCWGKLYRREALEAIRFDETLTIGEDMYFLLNTAARASKITISDYRGYAYFQNPRGAMNRAFKDSYMDQITCWLRAAAQINHIRPDLTHRATGKVLIAVMLTIGKIAVLPRQKRRQFTMQLKICHQVLKENLKVPGAWASLDRGYRLKTRLYRHFPCLYILMYHDWKCRSD